MYLNIFVPIQWIQNIILGLLTGIIFFQLEDDGPNVFIDRCVMYMYVCMYVYMYACMYVCMYVTCSMFYYTDLVHFSFL